MKSKKITVRAKKVRKIFRYGAAELYGQNLSTMPPDKIRYLSNADHKTIVCPFKPAEPGKRPSMCIKKGGVCSIRNYCLDPAGVVTAVDEPVATCPQRFLEGDLIYEWVGSTLLGTDKPLILSELPFLMGERGSDKKKPLAVGKIDKVLVNATTGTLNWCALEMQAVYFSGMKMENDFAVMRNWTGPGIPFPPVNRRPDFRSSGPKRLMPQLQIKVPTISRWGKKMAVIIDRTFWKSLGEMREIPEISNSEIIWFVVSFLESSGERSAINRHEIHSTTLSHAVEGLTGGTPVSLDHFEDEIRRRLEKS